MIEFRLNEGPALMLADCLAPTIVLRKEADGRIVCPCPVCGADADDATAPGGGLMLTHLVGGVLYGMGVLQPCGHEIGAIDIEEAPDA